MDRDWLRGRGPLLVTSKYLSPQFHTQFSGLSKWVLNLLTGLILRYFALLVSLIDDAYSDVFRNLPYIDREEKLEGENSSFSAVDVSTSTQNVQKPPEAIG